MSCFISFLKYTQAISTCLTTKYLHKFLLFLQARQLFCFYCVKCKYFTRVMSQNSLLTLMLFIS